MICWEYMRQSIALVSLAALLAIAIAGPFAMAHGMSHSSDCFLSYASSLCMTMANITEHVTALQRILTAVPVAALTALLGTALMFAGLFGGATRPTPASAIAHAHASLRERRDASSYSLIPLARWHARLVHSPTAS